MFHCPTSRHSPAFSSPEAQRYQGDGISPASPQNIPNSPSASQPTICTAPPPRHHHVWCYLTPGSHIPPWKPPRMTPCPRRQRWGLGSPGARGAAGAKGPRGLAATCVGRGRARGGSVAMRKGSCALTPCLELTSRDEKPCKGWVAGVRAFAGCGAPSPMRWVCREGGSRPSPVESGSDRPEGSRQLSAGGG